MNRHELTHHQPSSCDDTYMRMIAHHEAAHAVAAEAFYLNLEEVSLTPSGNFPGSRGYCGLRMDPLALLEDSRSSWAKKRLGQVAVFALAGNAAEARYVAELLHEQFAQQLETEVIEDEWGLDGTDLEMVQQAAALVGGTPAEETTAIEDWTLAAEEFVDEHWSLIRLLADALFEHVTLGRAQVMDILEPEA